MKWEEHVVKYLRPIIGKEYPFMCTWHAIVKHSVWQVLRAQIMAFRSIKSAHRRQDEARKAGVRRYNVSPCSIMQHVPLLDQPPWLHVHCLLLQHKWDGHTGPPYVSPSSRASRTGLQMASFTRMCRAAAEGHAVAVAR